MTLLKHLNSQSIMEEKIAFPDKETEWYSMYRIGGVANKVVKGDGAYGPWVAFKGDFEAFRFHDKERFRASKCFLPPAVSDAVETLLSIHPDGEIKFCCDVSIKKTTRAGGCGYEYVSEMVSKLQENDALRDLFNEAEKGRPAPSGSSLVKKALPAPVKPANK